MFTWCRKGYSDNQAEAPYQYLTTQYEANANCIFPTLNGPTRSSSGTPADKIDIDTYLRGQGRSLQPLCNNYGQSLSDEATWRWAEIQSPNQRATCSLDPASLASQSQFITDSWEEEAKKKASDYTCGAEKEQPFQRNGVRPMCSPNSFSSPN